MKTLLTTLLVAGMSLLATATFAYPTLSGPSGLVAIPTSETAPTAQLQVAGDLNFTRDSATGAKESVPVRVLVGIAPYAEVGATACLAKVGSTGADTFGLNAKVRSPLGLILNWAAGAQFLQTQRGADAPAFAKTVKTTQLYVTGTNSTFSLFGYGLKGTIGANWTKVSGTASNSATRGMAGAELTLPFRIAVAAEYQTGATSIGDAKPLSSIALRLPVMKFTGQIAYTNAGLNAAGLTSERKHHLDLGLDWAWGGL